MQRPVRSAASKVTIRRLPASGNTALAASALIQAALGIEFLLSGLNKLADPNFVGNFKAFVDASPGTHTGLLAGLIHALVQPNIGFFASLTKYAELGLGRFLSFSAPRPGAFVTVGAGPRRPWTLARAGAWGSVPPGARHAPPRRPVESPRP